MATKKEMRLTFNEKDSDIIEYLNGKTSKTAFIKDLIRREMKIEESYMANGTLIKHESNVPCETIEVKEEVQDEYDFDLSDLGL